MKQTFNIPDGCSTVTVEQVGNQLITTFEPEKYVPKVGDCVKMQYNEKSVPTFCLIYKIENGRILSKNVWIKAREWFNAVLFEEANFSAYDSIEKITPEQFQAEFEKLGYIYDFKTNTASKKRWTPKKWDDYFSFGCEGATTWNDDNVDKWRLKNNVVFKTESERDEALIKFNNK